jgi:hypothetical protein
MASDPLFVLIYDRTTTVESFSAEVDKKLALRDEGMANKHIHLFSQFLYSNLAIFFYASHDCEIFSHRFLE